MSVWFRLDSQLLDLSLGQLSPSLFPLLPISLLPFCLFPPFPFFPMRGTKYCVYTYYGGGTKKLWSLKGHLWFLSGVLVVFDIMDLPRIHSIHPSRKVVPHPAFSALHPWSLRWHWWFLIRVLFFLPY